MFKTFKKLFSLINPVKDAKAGAEVISDMWQASINSNADRVQLQDAPEDLRQERSTQLRSEAKFLILTTYVAATLAVWAGFSIHSIVPMVIGAFLVISGSVSSLMKFWAADMIEHGRPTTLANYIRSLFVVGDKEA